MDIPSFQSSGMYVKLAFSVAAHLDSEIMIMDEVLAVGDVKFQDKCLSKMSDVSRINGRTILYISHNMNTVRKLCNRCIVLNRGKIVFDGDVEKAIEIYTGYNSLSDNLVDLSKMKRSALFSDDSVRFIDMTIDSSTSTFETGQVLVGYLRVKSRINLSNVRLEYVVKSYTGVPVARFLSKPSIELKANIINQIRFEMDISHIAPGTYTLGPIIREINSWGSERHLDGIVEAYRFEIISSVDLNNGTIWNPMWSGYYMPPELKINRMDG